VPMILSFLLCGNSRMCGTFLKPQIFTLNHLLDRGEIDISLLSQVKWISKIE
jgi:hypothetical protein